MEIVYIFIRVFRSHLDERRCSQRAKLCKLLEANGIENNFRFMASARRCGCLCIGQLRIEGWLLEEVIYTIA